MISKKKDYNNVPVKYCDRCLSLKVLSLENRFRNEPPTEIDYCGRCGSIDIYETHIESWKILYDSMYKTNELPEISTWIQEGDKKVHYFEYKNSMQKESITNILEIFCKNNPDYSISHEKGKIKICRAI